jgi:hypothetical protein
VASSLSAATPSPPSPTSFAPANSPFNLVLAVKMPYTKAQFDGDKQNMFKEAMASAGFVVL